MRSTALIFLLFVLVSCEAGTDTSFTPQIVIQGFLYANEPLDSIVIRKTLSISANNEGDRISNAIVLLSDGDSVYSLRESNTSGVSGQYVTTQPLIIKPGKTYSLSVEALGQVATAETTIPAAIHLDSVKYRGRSLSLTGLDTVAYPTRVDSLSTPSIQQWWSKSDGAAGYGLEALSLDKKADTILVDFQTPLPDSTSEGRYRFFILSTTEQVVWLQFKRYGLNVIRALALDKNYEDFVLGLYISGSQFNNQTLHITNGVGVFGSAARTSKRIYIK